MLGSDAKRYQVPPVAVNAVTFVRPTVFAAGSPNSRLSRCDPLLSKGKISFTGMADELKDDAKLREVYL